MRPELGTVGWRGDGFQKSLGVNGSRTLGQDIGADWP